MDKYEYKLKAEEIVRLAGKKQYKAAAKIADDILWEKVKNIQMLGTVSEIYEQIGRYEDSKEVLLIAFRRSPNKAILYRLVELYIMLKDYKEATSYYHEYMELAPTDSSALTLKYKLYKARGAKLETQIAILEEFKERDYEEEWILELARLYHQAGQADKCIELCDEIDLWFNTGETVMRALELKRIYEPLTILQEQKLADYNENKKNMPVSYEEEYEEEPVRKVSPAPVVRAAVQPQETLGQSGVQEITEDASRSSVDTVAEAIIRMARPQTTGPKDELQQGFSVLPKGEVVTGDAEEFAFDLPEGVEQVQLSETAKETEYTGTQEKVMEETDATIEEDAVDKKTFNEEDSYEEEDAYGEEDSMDDDSSDEDDLEYMDSESDTESEDDYEEAKDEPKGIFGKMMSRLRMEDDDLDDDFDDDYDDSDEFEDEEDVMVTRGLTGQYEKVVIEEDDDENDPLNARMTAPTPVVEDDEEDEYEYIFGEDDEYEEYDDVEDSDEEEEPQTRENKRFRFFRNTMDDDELYEDDEEVEYVEDIYQEQVIPLSYATKYDTLNLQKELAKSIQQLMDATEKEAVDSTLENVKKMVENSNIPELTETMRFKAIRGNMLNSVAKRQAEKLQQAMDIEEVVMHNAANAESEPAEDATVSMADARPKPAVELAIKLKPTTSEENVPIEHILTQEDDGQLSLLMPEEEMVEKQITGQLNIEDVLREWEKQELLSETDKEKRALEEARKRALEETQGIMSEIMNLLKDVIPKIGSIKEGEEKMSVLAESLERIQKSLPYTQGLMEAAEESKEAASAIEAACAEAVMELEMLEAGQEPEEEVLPEEEVAQEEEIQLEEAAQEEVQPEEAVLDSMEQKIEDNLPEGMEALVEEIEEAIEDEPVAESEDLQEESEEEQVENSEYLNEQMALHKVYSQGTPGIAEEMIAVAEVLSADVTAMVAAAEAQAAVSEELVPELDKVEEPKEAIDNTAVEEEPDEPVELDDEQKDILAYFLAIKSVKNRISRIVKLSEKSPEHMIITGDAGSGKTSVAMRIIKASQVNKENKIETIAKIKAELLNQKEITEIMGKVDGGVLIIENAGSLKPTTVYSIEEALKSKKYQVQIIITDKKEAIARLLSSTRSFLNEITMRVDLPIYTNNELAEFAKIYAEVNGYTFDGMAILALHSVIEIFQTDDHVANLEDMKNIMDDAMESADRRNRKLLGKLFGKKNTDGIVLMESDFE